MALENQLLLAIPDRGWHSLMKNAFAGAYETGVAA
jgi:hypothetical protein